jgi:WD40 repeat protein
MVRKTMGSDVIHKPGEIYSADKKYRFNNDYLSDPVVDVLDNRGEKIRFFELFGHEEIIDEAKFSPDSRLFITSSTLDGDARLWSTNNGHLITILASQEKGVESVAFAPDNAHIAILYRGGAVRIWRIEKA